MTSRRSPCAGDGLAKGRRAARTTTLVVSICALHPWSAEATESAGRCGPAFVHVEPASGKLLVLCEKSGTIVRMDAETGVIESTAPTGKSPWALCPHPDGQRLYVSCRQGQEVLELDAKSLTALRRFPCLGDPTGVAVSADGRRLYVGVHSLDQLAVFDLETGEETKRLPTGNGPQMVRLAPRTGRLYVTNLLPNRTPQDKPCRNEITVIDDASARVVDRVILDNANVGRWMAFTPDETMAIVAISRPKNLIPMLQVARGWMITNGFAVLSPTGDRPPIQLLVDLPNQSYADPDAVVITPDGHKCYLTSAGLDTVIAIDLARLRNVADQAAAGLLPRHADDMGLSREYVSARIPVGANPQALALSTDGQQLYVANRLDDSVSVIDTRIDRVVRTIVIGDPASPNRLLRGERFFYNAAHTFQGQFSCASCHPDGGFDGLQYDLEPDGIGENIVDNRNMRGVADTAPFKWVGTNPDISTQCGTRTAKWFVRTGWLNAVQVTDLATYINSIEPVVNPFRLPDGSLTDAQRRGKALFERVVTSKDDPIPERNRCHVCHSGPKYTNGLRADVGTKAPRDSGAEFDAAHLINVFESAPYLHDGRAATLEEIWTKFNLEDKHGVSSDWTKQQLNDLVEYLKCL